MSTSTYGYLVRADTTIYQDESVPVDTTIARDVVLNNLCHAADQFAQVRVAFSAAGTSLSGGQGYVNPRTTYRVAGEFYRVGSFGPFPLAVRESGPSYKMRIRLAGLSSDNTNTATFRVSLSPTDRPYGATVLDDGPHVWEAATASSTSAWLTGANLGDSDATQIYLNETLVGQCTRLTTPTYTTTGGNPVTVTQCLVYLNVFAKVSNTATTPRMTALYAAEYVGV